MPESDVIIIGAGPAGTHAAAALVESGISVLLLDGGNTGPEIPEPDTDFVGLRQERRDQWRWFLGEELSGIPVDGLTGGLGGGQVSGNRGYVVRDAERELPIELKNAQVIQSLAEGGLAAAWGATSAYLTDEELTMMGLPAERMQACYDDITDLVGISGPPTRKGVDPPLKLDHHAESVLAQYGKKRAWFEREHLRVLQPHAAILTKDKGSRKATSYGDLDYVADQGKSVYRPQYTLAELRMSPLFRVERCVVESCQETADGVSVSAHVTGGESKKTFTAKKVILAAGAVGSARLLLRTLGLRNVKTPFLGKHHVFSACLDLATFGQAGPRNRTSLCQLILLDDELRQGLNAGLAQLYSYRSLQLFKLLGSLPLSTPEALRVLSVLAPALVIADIRFPAFRSEASTLMLREDNTVEIACAVSDEERSQRIRSWKRFRRAFRKLGIPALKNMWLPEASSSHYAGTIPVSDDPALPLSADPEGKVRQCRNLWVADASLFAVLPAKPHTLTIMANARRIGKSVAANLR